MPEVINKFNCLAESVPVYVNLQIVARLYPVNYKYLGTSAYIGNINDRVSVIHVALATTTASTITMLSYYFL